MNNFFFLFPPQLGLHGEQIDEKDNTAGDPTFLEEVMEANEELSRAPPPPPSRLRDMQELNNSENVQIATALLTQLISD